MEMILDRVSSGLGGPSLLSGFVLAVANMIPVVGVIMWEWGLFEILGIYWVEILIIGILNIPRILMAGKQRKTGSLPGSKFLLVILFAVQFILFLSVHAFFVFFLKEESIHSFLTAAPDLLVTVSSVTAWGFLGMFCGHLFSFFWNFIGQREYREMVAEDRVYQPFQRVVILHILVLFAAFAVAIYGPTLLILLGFITGKTAFDLGFHFYYRAKV